MPVALKALFTQITKNSLAEFQAVSDPLAEWTIRDHRSLVGVTVSCKLMVKVGAEAWNMS